MTFDLEKILVSKLNLHRRLAALPVAEKLTMLDAMAERAQSLHAARAAPPSDAAHPPDKKPDSDL